MIPYIKKIKTNYETQFPINLVLKNEIEKINKKQKKNQPKLTFQTHDQVHETRINS